MIGLRASPELREMIEAWAKQQEDGPVLSEAIRRLVELGLTVSQPAKHTSPKAAAKASDMASEQIKKLISPLLPEEEKRARKRRLIKGPEEFREMRGDRAKRKK